MVDIDESSLGKLGDTIGSGSYGVIKEGKYKEESIAVKEFKSYDKNIPGDLFREIAIYCLLKEVKAPNMTNFIGAKFSMDKEYDQSFLFLEKAPKTLETLSQDLSEDEKIELFPKLMDLALASLAELHACNIIHGDVHTKNILVFYSSHMFVPANSLDSIQEHSTKSLDPESNSRQVASPNVGPSAGVGVGASTHTIHQREGSENLKHEKINLRKVSVIDFSLSTSIPEKEQYYYVQGFRAPEIDDELGVSTKETDIYAMGITLARFFNSKEAVPFNERTVSFLKKTGRYEDILRMIDTEPASRSKLELPTFTFPLRYAFIGDTAILEIEYRRLFKTFFESISKWRHLRKLSEVGIYVHMIDIACRYLNKIQVESKEMKLLLFSALSIAMKWSLRDYPEYPNFVKIGQHLFQEDDIRDYEIKITKVLNGLLYLPGLEKIMNVISSTVSVTKDYSVPLVLEKLADTFSFMADNWENSLRASLD